MKALENVIREMDFDFFGSGEHAMSPEGVRQVLDNDHFVFLDVRADEEARYLTFPFAVRIPLHELPDRIDELPRDKCIVTFCASIFRAAIAYTLLMAKGFEEVKGVPVCCDELAVIFKPGPIYSMK
jgi:rhodanese-related sulfurtransferase